MVFPGTLVSSTNKTDRHDIAEILLKVALSTITPNKTSLVIVTLHRMNEMEAHFKFKNKGGQCLLILKHELLFRTDSGLIQLNRCMLVSFCYTLFLMVKLTHHLSLTVPIQEPNIKRHRSWYLYSSMI